MQELGKTNIPDYFDNNLYEYLIDEFYEQYVILKGKLYKTNNEYLEIDFNFFEAKENEDGTIDYHCMYYNGGCCLEEAIEKAVKNMRYDN